MFVAGWTSGGFPYGVTEEEMRADGHRRHLPVESGFVDPSRLKKPTVDMFDPETAFEDPTGQ